MLEKAYSMIEEGIVEAESVAAFCERYIRGDEMESSFSEVIRDSQRVGFQAGLKMALAFFAEVR